MLPLHSVEMTRQRLNDSSRQDGWPIFLALASPNHNLPSFEIDVLHAQVQTFLQPKPGTIKESDDHPRDAIEILHDAGDLVAAEDDGHTNGHASARHVFDGVNVQVQHVAIQKQHCAERLILCRGTDASIHREPAEKRADFRRAHFRGMPLPVKEDVSPNPVDVGAFGSTTVMFRADDMSNTIEQLRRTSRRNCAGRSVAALPLHDAGFFHGEGPLDDDGIVSTNRSTRRRGHLRQPETTPTGDRPDIKRQATILSLTGFESSHTLSGIRLWRSVATPPRSV